MIVKFYNKKILVYSTTTEDLNKTVEAMKINTNFVWTRYKIYKKQIRTKNTSNYQNIYVFKGIGAIVYDKTGENAYEIIDAIKNDYSYGKKCPYTVKNIKTGEIKKLYSGLMYSPK